MNRFLTVASSALIATGLAVLPVAAFAQTSGDAAKTPAATQAPVVSQDKTQPTKTAPAATTAKTDEKAPVMGKTETHSAKTTVKHHVAKAPVKDSVSKG